MDTNTHTPPSPPPGATAPAGESLRRGYEVSDASIRAVVNFMVYLTVGTLLICIGVYVLRNAMRSHFTATDQRESPWGDAHDPPPEPRLEPSVDHPILDHEDLLALRNQWDHQLHSYARVEGSTNLVSIPIERAMQLMAQRGIQPTTRPTTAPGTGGAK